MVGIGCKIRLKIKKQDWVNALIRSKFSGPCVDHGGFRKNERNVFCIDCKRCFCRHCIPSSHQYHTWLQICKYVYHDVVRLHDIQRLLDCSDIQTYKINGEKAIHLNSRPQSKDSNKTSSKTRNGTSCEACGRYIQDTPNRFCSIECKAKVYSEQSGDENNRNIFSPILKVSKLSLKEDSNPKENDTMMSNKNESSDIFLADSPEEEEAQGIVSSELKPKKQMRRRKGVPNRAPMT